MSKNALCDCYRAGTTTLVCAYSMSHEKDREHAARLSRIIPIEHLVAPGMSAHNLVEKLAQRNAVATFFDLIFYLQKEKSDAGGHAGRLQDAAAAPLLT